MIRLTDEAKGFRDLYWCWARNEPVLVWAGNPCSECGLDVVVAAGVEDSRHTFVKHVTKE